MPTDDFSGDAVPLANSIEGSIGSTFLALETAPPLREPSARSARRFRRQTVAEAAAAAEAVASVATAVHEPAAAVATADASASASRSVVGTAVASVPTVVHEPAAAVATADPSASAPRSVFGTPLKACKPFYIQLYPIPYALLGSRGNTIPQERRGHYFCKIYRSFVCAGGWRESRVRRKYRSYCVARRQFGGFCVIMDPRKTKL